MVDVTCRRCGETKAGLEAAPLPGAWGVRVHRDTCVDCWTAWKEEQTRLINHERLQPALPADRARLYEHLQAFLHLCDEAPAKS